MTFRVRLLLTGVLFLSASHLALPAAVAAEPDPGAAWMGHEPVEPAAAIPADHAGDATLVVEPPVTGDGPELLEVDLWGEFFTTSSGSRVASKPDPLGRPTEPPRSASALVAEASARVSSYEIQQNEHVLRFLEQFQTGYRRAIVERWLTRSGRYLPMILDVFRQKGLPEELVFTAMIESGFNPIAVSHAGAKGLWQFMAPTARRYGLRVDRWLDERLDPEKATVAAANYLSDLYKLFGSWELAQAAYNAGEMKVLRAIQGSGTRDFWSLTRTRLLRDETKNFVPAIHAVALIGQEPEGYGFTVQPEEPLSYEQITVPKATSLKHVAGLSGIPLEELVRLNSELRLKQTPPDSPYHLKVPRGSGAALQAGLDREAEARRTAVASRAADRGKRKIQVAAPAPAGVHVVQPRDTIGGIAKRYGVSVRQLARWNDLERGARIFPGDRLRVAAASQTDTEQGGFR
ncbi:MAG TPA: transglycosylase SLT domain-containing protein [Methylomirabilota bacterium]|nr:transglycosylase SLT domain-containing protein [Methylomirabilota bacterium]